MFAKRLTSLILALLLSFLSFKKEELNQLVSFTFRVER